MKPTILDFERGALAELVKELGGPKGAADPLWRALHRDGATHFGSVPQPLRTTLEARYHVEPFSPASRINSKDGSTSKWLFKLGDGELIETVLMRYEADDHRKARGTVCISTQAGCALGCTFCATGQQGFRRQLTAGEIVGQVIRMARLAEEEKAKITNVVFMGMGEPFANYENTMTAIRILTDGRGLKIGAGHITVSTVGLVPEIRRFAAEPIKTNLAVSLHAADDATRSATLPINKRYPIAQLLDACRFYVETAKRRVFFEYVLMSGQNDGADHARKLGTLLHGLDCHVNLIPVNPTGRGPYARPDDSKSDAFQAILAGNGVPSTMRVEKGIDISAGCGQLRARAVESRTK